MQRAVERGGRRLASRLTPKYAYARGDVARNHFYCAENFTEILVIAERESAVHVFHLSSAATLLFVQNEIQKHVRISVEITVVPAKYLDATSCSKAIMLKASTSYESTCW